MTARVKKSGGKVRFGGKSPQNTNDTCVGVQSQLRWVQDRAHIC